MTFNYKTLASHVNDRTLVRIRRSQRLSLLNLPLEDAGVDLAKSWLLLLALATPLFSLARSEAHHDGE